MFSGSIVALVTPMHEDGAIDYNHLARLIEWHIEQGTDAIVAVGTTGESATLSYAEHNAVIAFVVQQARGRIPVIAGTGSNSTQEALELTTAAKALRADAVLLVVPYYNKPTQEGLYQHYQLLAEQVALPQILYNVPGRTVTDLQPETVLRLAEIPNIIGIKEAANDRARWQQYADIDDFFLLSGEDVTTLEMLRMGGDGAISVTANIAPCLMHQMCQAALEKKWETAEQCDQKLLSLHQALFVESNPIAVKWALERLGLMRSGIRLPMTHLSPDKQAIVESALREADCLKS